MTRLRIAAIPVGGEAVRLRPLSIETSKALIRILNRPILEFIILELAINGIEDIYLGVRGYYNYKAVHDYFREGYWVRVKYPFIDHDVRIRYMPRYETSGNAEAVKILIEYYGINEPLVVVQCDNIFKLNLNKVLEFHKSVGADMVIVLKETKDVTGFGVAELGANNRITRFIEKPKPEEAPSNLINTGIYIVEPTVIEFFNTFHGKELLKTGKMDFGQHVIPKLIELGYNVYGYIMEEGYWFDIGTPERYLEAMEYLLHTKDYRILEAEEKIPNVFLQGRSPKSKEFHEDIIIKSKNGLIKFSGVTLIGRHVILGENTFIEDSSIDNYCIIGSNNHISRSAIMDRSYIEEEVKIVNSIIGRHVHIERGAIIINSYIGDNVCIGAYSKLINVKVWPHEKIPPQAHIENYEIKPHKPSELQ
ncbi:MAG: NDP-sugar synthase [Ignisphaera sp.]